MSFFKCALLSVKIFHVYFFPSIGYPFSLVYVIIILLLGKFDFERKMRDWWSKTQRAEAEWYAIYITKHYIWTTKSPQQKKCIRTKSNLRSAGDEIEVVEVVDLIYIELKILQKSLCTWFGESIDGNPFPFCVGFIERSIYFLRSRLSLLFHFIGKIIITRRQDQIHIRGN